VFGIRRDVLGNQRDQGFLGRMMWMWSEDVKGKGTKAARSDRLQGGGVKKEKKRQKGGELVGKPD